MQVLIRVQFLQCLLAPAIALLMTTLLAMQTSADTPQEPAVRAAMIFNLLKFVKWPETLSADAPLRICLVEASADLTSAVHALDQRVANTHPLTTRSVRANNLSACEVIVTDSMQAPFAPDQLQARGVLTIGEANFIDRGGMIGIAVIANRVRFEINNSAMQSAGIILPAQVLHLAVRTR